MHILTGKGGECDFESGFCMYQDSGDEQSPWVVYDGHNNYPGVPIKDHTLGEIVFSCLYSGNFKVTIHKISINYWVR